MQMTRLFQRNGQHERRGLADVGRGSDHDRRGRRDRGGRRLGARRAAIGAGSGLRRPEPSSACC